MIILTKKGAMLICVVLFSCANALADPVDMQAAKTEFQKMDANHDGFVTPEEMQAYQEKRFNELDKDKNEVLDAKELEADKTNMFKGADKNNDGKVDRKESSAQFKEYFKEMDSNKDGKISETEFKEHNPIVIKF